MVGTALCLVLLCPMTTSNVNEFTSSIEMRTNLNCLSVNQIIVFRTLIFIRRMINGDVPKYSFERIKFNRDTQHRILRNV